MSEINNFAWKVLCSAGVSFRKMLGSVLFRVMLFLMILFWILFVWNIRGVTAAAGGSYGVTPWLLPHFFASSIYVVYGELMLILLNCNAPFLDRTKDLTLTRSGLLPWCLGQILFIVLSNLFFQVLMFVTEVITLLPYVSFSTNWGSVIYTISENPMIVYQFTGYGSIEPTIVSSMTPLEAMGLQILLCVCFGSAVGMSMFFINGILRKNIGSVVMAGCVFFAGYLYTLNMYFDLDLADKFFFNWLSLADYIDGTMDYGSHVLILVAMFLVFAAASCVGVKKRWIRTVE